MSEAAPLDGRIRLKCTACGEIGPAIYRYFPGEAHLAKNYDDSAIRRFFEDHAMHQVEEDTPAMEFIAD